MALSQEEKDWCLSTAINLAAKLAEGGGIDKGAEIAYSIELCYSTLCKLVESKKS